MTTALSIAVGILACITIALSFMVMALIWKVHALEDTLANMEWQRSRQRHPSGRTAREHPETL